MLPNPHSCVDLADWVLGEAEAGERGFALQQQCWKAAALSSKVALTVFVSIFGQLTRHKFCTQSNSTHDIS